MIWNKDGNAGSLPILECPGHRGNSGGGKPTPPTVHPMRHFGPLAGNERQSPYHRSVRQGSGVKEAAASRDRVKGELREGL